jgi:hypothetical protein
MQEHSGLSARMWQIISAVMILLTLAVGYMVTDAPRSLFTWVVIVFLCVVELALGIILSLQAASGTPGKISHAMSPALVGSGVLYGFVGLATICSLYAVRKSLENFDRVLISALVVETAIFVIALVLLQRVDLAVQPKDESARQANDRAVSKSARISEFVRLLRSIKPKNLEESQRIEYLIKSFESCEFQLQRSYRTLSPEMEDSLNTALTQIDIVGPVLVREGFSQSSLQSVEAVLQDLQGSTRSLVLR